MEPDSIPKQSRCLELLRASERRLMEGICTFTQEDGYVVVRSEAFPRFYSGNGLIAETRHRERGIQEWVDLYRRHFPAKRYRHVTLRFPADTIDSHLLEQAAPRGFRVVTEALMVAPSVVVGQREDPRRSRIRSLSTAADMQSLYELHAAQAREAEWFEDEAAVRELFRKTVSMSEQAGVEWLAISLDELTADVDAALGCFDEGDLCRLEEVITAPPMRRLGLATLLVREVARRAHARGIESVGLFAEVGGTASRLYTRLGFRECARDVTILHY
jgi:ribosomal protein S18 acetylase RimI-like enzyme